MHTMKAGELCCNYIVSNSSSKRPYTNVNFPVVSTRSGELEGQIYTTTLTESTVFKSSHAGEIGMHIAHVRTIVGCTPGTSVGRE